MPIPPCQDCGVCCTGAGDRYVPLTGDDHERLGPLAAILTHFEGIRCYMRMQNGRCAALEVDAAGRRFSCSVYDRRPSVCRELERGSASCAAERERKGDRTHHAAAPHPRSPMP